MILNPLSMKCIVVLAALVASATALAQPRQAEAIRKTITRDEIEAHLTFLAADEMRGRDTGSPELAIAGNYIAAYFKRCGLSELPGAPGYFQPVDLTKVASATAGEAVIGTTTFKLKDSMLALAGGNIAWTGDYVFVGFGSSDELAKANIKGKMVLAFAGARDSDNINKVFSASADKRAEVQKLGGMGLVEVLAIAQVPWPGLVNFLSGSRWGIKSDAAIPHVWLKPEDVRALGLREGAVVSGSLRIEGAGEQVVPGRNVAALIKGTDPKLADEYIVMTAHYDHVGFQSKGNGEDSIFNGARDNAIGTVALLQAAKYLSHYPPRHSVILVALTSEEKGLLGSQWYVEHPLVPLVKTVLAINCDGVGYNDKTRITSISLGRTTVDKLLTTAATEFGLTLGGDPDPKENFYERSDQVSFAKKGVPAIKLQPGLAQMDEEIRKYYHRQADEVGSLDFDYLLKFYQSYVNAVQLLANDKQRPQWVKGDKFEPLFKKLYNTK